MDRAVGWNSKDSKGHWLSFALAVGVFIGGVEAPARACGQSMHAWIALQAVSHLPPGELRDLLSGPDAEQLLRNGCMFPDGGYATGLRDYAETLHWEPFQDRYLGWIRAHFQAPWSDEAALHIAFLMGMAAHGMADQLFDSTFMESARAHDPAGWSGCSGVLCGFDTFTDVLWAQRTGPQPAPELWVPAEPVAALMREGFQIEVSPAKIEAAQVVVSMALKASKSFAADAGALAQEQRDNPWAFEHIDDPAVAGTPSVMAPIVARYWQVLWERLQGRSWAEASLLGVMAGHQGYGLERAAVNPESWISVVFPRGLSLPALAQGSFRILSSAGAPQPFEAVLFYGQNSHVVNLRPRLDWAQDELYTVEIGPGVLGLDGVATAGAFSFRVSTGPRPPLPDPAPNPVAGTQDGGGSGCAHQPGAPGNLGWLLSLLVSGIWWRTLFMGRKKS